MWLLSGRWILDLAWLLFLLMVFRHFWQERRTLLQAQTWLKAKGRITDCQWTQVGSNFWPKINYSYQVYDQDLLGDHLLLDTSYHTPYSKHARRVAYHAAIAFRDQQEIAVYYNPNQPEQSALDIAMPVKLTVIIIAIGTLTLVHLVLISFRLWG